MIQINKWGKSVSGYWGSPLNKFVDLYCEHNFTNINIDCFQLKFETKRIRFIEYKRAGEYLGDQQRKSLVKLAELLSGFMISEWKFEVLVIEGNEPFNTIKVYKLPSFEEKIITGFHTVKEYLSL